MKGRGSLLKRKLLCVQRTRKIGKQSDGWRQAASSGVLVLLFSSLAHESTRGPFDHLVDLSHGARGVLRFDGVLAQPSETLETKVSNASG